MTHNYATFVSKCRYYLRIYIDNLFILFQITTTAIGS